MHWSIVRAEADGGAGAERLERGDAHLLRRLRRAGVGARAARVTAAARGRIHRSSRPRRRWCRPCRPRPAPPSLAGVAFEPPHASARRATSPHARRSIRFSRSPRARPRAVLPRRRSRRPRPARGSSWKISARASWRSIVARNGRSAASRREILDGLGEELAEGRLAEREPRPVDRPPFRGRNPLRSAGRRRGSRKPAPAARRARGR